MWEVISDLTGDPGSEFYTLTHFDEDSLCVVFNAPIAYRLKEVLREEAPGLVDNFEVIDPNHARLWEGNCD